MGDFSDIFEDRSVNFGFEEVEKNKSEFGNKYIVLPNPMYGKWENAVFENNRDLTNEEKYELRKKNLIAY